MSEGRYAIPSAEDNHLPLAPSLAGAGSSTHVFSPIATSQREEQLENMEYTLPTFEVSQEERSREVSDEQPENI